MSLLLDALNKADQERKRNEGAPGINSNHESYADAHHYRPSLLVIALIALVSIASAGAIFYWLNTSSSKNTLAQKAAVAAATPKPAAKKTAAAKAKSAAATSSLASSVSSEAANTDDDEQATLVDEATDESVASLYQQQSAIAALNAQARMPEVMPPPPQPTFQQPNLQQPQPTESALPAPVSINQFANLPYIQDLPRGILDKLPTLKYEQHNFNGISGTVVINGVVRHADDQLGNGLVIDKILQDGMILHLDNFSFKIRALNSWVNM